MHRGKKFIMPLEDLIEDMAALSSDEYLRSIEEARKDYKEGKIKSLDRL